MKKLRLASACMSIITLVSPIVMAGDPGDGKIVLPPMIPPATLGSYENNQHTVFLSPLPITPTAGSAPQYLFPDQQETTTDANIYSTETTKPPKSKRPRSSYTCEVTDTNGASTSKTGPTDDESGMASVPKTGLSMSPSEVIELEMKSKYGCICGYASLCTEKKLSELSRTITQNLCTAIDIACVSDAYSYLDVSFLIFINQICKYPSSQTYETVQENVQMITRVADSTYDTATNILSPKLKKFSSILQKYRKYIEDGKNIYTIPSTAQAVNKFFATRTYNDRAFSFLINSLSVSTMITTLNEAVHSDTPLDVNFLGITLLGLSYFSKRFSPNIRHIRLRKAQLTKILELLKSRGLCDSLSKIIEKKIDTLTIL